MLDHACSMTNLSKLPTTLGVCIAALLLSAGIARADAGSVGPGMAESAPPADWQQLIEDRLEAKLRDPYSAIKKVTRGPRYGWVSESIMRTHVGWMVCYSVNAKNAYGGYVGARQHVFVITDGKIAAEYALPGDRSIVEAECSLPIAPPVVDDASENENPKLGI